MINLPGGYGVIADNYSFILGKKYASMDKKTGKTTIAIRHPIYSNNFVSILKHYSRYVQLDAIRDKEGTLEEAVDALTTALTALSTSLDAICDKQIYRLAELESRTQIEVDENSVGVSDSEEDVDI